MLALRGRGNELAAAAGDQAEAEKPPRHEGSTVDLLRIARRRAEAKLPLSCGGSYPWGK